jgi:CPA2 family monovalent cation:H+ antiporter-2
LLEPIAHFDSALKGGMMHDIDLILTLTGGLSAALVFGFVTQALRLSPIVGYLLAGILVGPFTPGFVADGGIAEQLAEVGVILLMFGVGLHFHVDELLSVRKVALPGALVQITAATVLGVLVTRAFGWSLAAGIVFGLSISVASTVVLLRVLSDSGSLHTRAGHVALGWLIVEDLFTVLVLVLLPVVAGQEAKGGTSDVVLAVLFAVAKIGGLVAFALIVGQRVIPRLLGYVARTRSRELFTLSVLVLALGIAVGSAKLFGASMALGAFLGGMIVGQSHFSARAASEALPMRDAFAVLFFVSVGMLLDPAKLVTNAPLILATVLVVIVGKAVAAFAVVRLLGRPVHTAVVVAVALAQIGEFSFIVASLGREIEILPRSATEVLVAAAILSITLNPLLFRLAEPIASWLARDQSARPSSPTADTGSEDRAIVVGYGPVGKTLARLLGEHGIAPTIVELNHDTVATLRGEGTQAIYGDAAQAGVLEAAGVAGAKSLVFAASGTPPEAVIRMAKDLNPDVRILARSSYVSEAKAASKAGADIVVSAEAEVAFAMAEHLLVELGATPEQLDRARDRVRSEL